MAQRKRYITISGATSTAEKKPYDFPNSSGQPTWLERCSSYRDVTPRPRQYPIGSTNSLIGLKLTASAGRWMPVDLAIGPNATSVPLWIRSALSPEANIGFAKPEVRPALQISLMSVVQRLNTCTPRRQDGIASPTLAWSRGVG